MSEQCAYDWPNCTRPVVDVAVAFNPNVPDRPACLHHLRLLVGAHLQSAKDDNALHVQVAKQMHATNDLQPDGERCECGGFHYSDVTATKRVIRALAEVWS
jgi:hypothetical protein